MTGASRTVESGLPSASPCTAASGSRACSLSITTVAPSGNTVKGRTRADYGIAQRPKDRSLDAKVALPLRCHGDDLPPYQLVAAARLGGRPGQELRDGHAARLRLRGHMRSIPHFVALQIHDTETGCAR